MSRRVCICPGTGRRAPGAHGPLCPAGPAARARSNAQGRPVEAGGWRVLYDDGVIYLGTRLFDRSGYLGRPLRRC